MSSEHKSPFNFKLIVENFRYGHIAIGRAGSHGNDVVFFRIIFLFIPAKNIINLMLDQEVIEAVDAGKFLIYAIDQMEEGLEILTDKEAGTLSEDGKYPEGTINYFVEKRLTEIRDAMKPGKDRKSNDENNKEDE